MTRRLFTIVVVSLLVILPRFVFAQSDTVTRSLIKLAGQVGVRYQYSPDSLRSGVVNNFSVTYARIMIRGTIPSARLSYHVKGEFAGERPSLLDAYLLWAPFDFLKLKVGQFFIPFSIDGQTFSFEREIIPRPLVISHLGMFKDWKGGHNSRGRDIGAMLTGELLPSPNHDFHYLTYKVGFFNGSGINCSDHDKMKDFIAQIILSPFARLKLEGSMVYGWSGDKSPIVRDGVDALLQEYGGARDRFNGGFEFNNTRLLLRGEYSFGRTDALNFIANKLDLVESQGAFLLAGYTFKEQYQTVLRVDAFEYEKGGNLGGQITFAFNYKYNVNFRLQANYLCASEYAPAYTTVNATEFDGYRLMTMRHHLYLQAIYRIN